MKPTTPRSKRPQSGVILVLVLLMLTLCACIAAQVASRTIRLTGQAADSQRELQARWAMVSLRRTLLNDAQALLTAPNPETSALRPIALRQETILLGGIRYQIALQDESAKAPIARMLRNKNQQDIEPILRQLLQGRAILQSSIPAKPTHWREIIDTPNPTASSDNASMLLAATRRMTLWSDGRLNILTADSETLDAVWRYQFNTPAPEVLTSARQNISTDADLESQFFGQGLSERQRAFATSWLTTKSASFSLWITQSAPNGKSNAAVYVRSSQPGYADDHFGLHNP